MSTNVSYFEQTQKNSLVQTVKAGVIAGLGGGMVFGMMMGMMGMLPMVGMLVGQENAVVGFMVHMMISAFIGATFGPLISRVPSGWGTASIGGGVYGIVWWVLGALIMMPLMLGMPQMVFVIGSTQWMSLLGHIIFGVVTGALFIPLSRRFATH